MSLGEIERTISWHRRGLDEPWLPDSFMAELPPEMLRRILRHGRMRTDIESVALSGEDAAVVIVLNGAVKVLRSHWGGKQTLVHVAGFGDVLNAETLLTGYDIPHMRLAAKDGSAVLAIPRRRFNHLIASDEDSLRALTRDFARRAQEHDVWRGHVGWPLEAQVWAFLVGLARRHGQRVTTGTHLDLGLTQLDIASALGVSGSSVEKAMRQLRETGRLRTGRTWVELRDVPSEESLDLDY